MMMPALPVTQNDSMLRNGNAMSRAPIISGMQKFPKAPARIGMITKKIMIVAGVVDVRVSGRAVGAHFLAFPSFLGSALPGASFFASALSSGLASVVGAASAVRFWAAHFAYSSAVWT